VDRTLWARFSKSEACVAQSLAILTVKSEQRSLLGPGAIRLPMVDGPRCVRYRDKASLTGGTRSLSPGTVVFVHGTGVRLAGLEESYAGVKQQAKK
jgi:hypothetical protein